MQQYLVRRLRERAKLVAKLTVTFADITDN